MEKSANGEKMLPADYDKLDYEEIKDRTSPTPHELSRLGYPWLEVALNAIFISGGNMKVQIQKNEKGIPELLLDVSSYEKTKQFHERFQQMQNDLDDEFDEEMEQ